MPLSHSHYTHPICCMFRLHKCIFHLFTILLACSYHSQLWQLYVKKLNSTMVLVKKSQARIGSSIANRNFEWLLCKPANLATAIEIL